MLGAGRERRRLGEPSGRGGGGVGKNSSDSVACTNHPAVKRGDEKRDECGPEARIGARMLANTRGDLNVGEANFEANAAARGMLALAAPPDAEAAGQSRSPAASAGRFGGNGMFKAGMGYGQRKASPPHDRADFQIAHKVTGGGTARDRVHASGPRGAVGVSRSAKRVGDLPQDIVRALARPALESQVAGGYLAFDRGRLVEKPRESKSPQIAPNLTDNRPITKPGSPRDSGFGREKPPRPPPPLPAGPVLPAFPADAAPAADARPDAAHEPVADGRARLFGRGRRLPHRRAALARVECQRPGRGFGVRLGLRHLSRAIRGDAGREFPACRRCGIVGIRGAGRAGAETPR